jgi:hypothetical protein
MTTYTYTGSLVIIECAGCHMDFGATPDFVRDRRKDSKTFYCPNRCSNYYPPGSDPESKLRKKLEAAEAQRVAAEDQLQAATITAEGLRRVLQRERARFANGVCPCCNRSFENVARHVAGQHPDYDITRVTLDEPLRYACSCGRDFGTLRGLHQHQSRQRPSDWWKQTSPYRTHLTKV